MIFTDKTSQILHAGGWKEDRLLPEDSFIEKLTKAGYKPHTAALEFLQRFGELEFTFLANTRGHKELEGYMLSYRFIIDYTIGYCDIEDIEDYGNCIGTILCPVGVKKNGSIITVADDGRVFSYFNPYICLDAMNYVDAIEKYCTEGAPIKRLVYDGNPLQF